MHRKGCKAIRWGSPTTHNAVPEFRIQESEFRIVVSASRTDIIFLFFIYVTEMLVTKALSNQISTHNSRHHVTGTTKEGPEPARMLNVNILVPALRILHR